MISNSEHSSNNAQSAISFFTSRVNWVGLYMLVSRDILRIFRVWVQTIASPLISATLYIFIFGKVVGSRIDLIAGVPYITFVFPGILAMNILTSAFMHSSSTTNFQRFMKTIQEVLVAPFSHIEMIIWLITGGIARGLIIAFGVLTIGVFFGAVTFAHPFFFLFYATAIAAIFSLLGIITGLWANNFEQLSFLNTFIIMPFSYLGGMFYSVTMLPPVAQVLVHLNPFFYFVDGLRYSMTGVTESNRIFGILFILALLSALFALVYRLLSIGWKIRE
jgi:ABC-2 type transport system permease protein